MHTTTKVETHKAKKIHRCEWCWQLIEVGTSYHRYRCYNDGDAGTVKMHLECYGAMEEESKLEGGFIEWTPGQERPSTVSLSCDKK
jgi:hypothetical protein